MVLVYSNCTMLMWAGTVGQFMLSRIVSSFLFDVSATDPWLYVLSAAVMLLTMVAVSIAGGEQGGYGAYLRAGCVKMHESIQDQRRFQHAKASVTATRKRTLSVLALTGSCWPQP